MWSCECRNNGFIGWVGSISLRTTKTWDGLGGALICAEFFSSTMTGGVTDRWSRLAASESGAGERAWDGPPAGETWPQARQDG